MPCGAEWDNYIGSQNFRIQKEAELAQAQAQEAYDWAVWDLCENP